MNNKGFAISTMLYGLSIVGLLLAILMVQTMSASRSEQRKLVNSIEEELSEFGILSEYFSYDENPYAQYDAAGNPISGTDDGHREFKTPIKGWYKIELWESSLYADTDEKVDLPPQQLDNFENPIYGGSYTSQTVYLQEGTTLYIYLGKNDNDAPVSSNNNLATDTTRETTVCNINTKCSIVTNTNSNNCIATATSRKTEFPSAGKTFVDPLNPDIKNTLSTDKISSQTLYYGDRININERGKARITLVSAIRPDTNKYQPLSTPINAEAKKSSGAFCIIDATNGKALSFGRIIGNDVSQSVEFITLSGNDSQKWKYNPKEQSLINVRSGFSLSIVPEVKDGSNVISSNQYMSEPFQKWNIAKVAGTGNVGMKVAGTTISPVAIYMSTSATNKYYLYHNRKALLADGDIDDGLDDDYTRVKQSTSLPVPANTNKNRSYTFYMINAY